MEVFYKVIKKVDGLYQGKFINFKKDKRNKSIEIVYGVLWLYLICYNLLK